MDLCSPTQNPKPNKELQQAPTASLYVCNNLFINCSLFVLASTCFTHCRENFLKVRIFVFQKNPGCYSPLAGSLSKRCIIACISCACIPNICSMVTGGGGGFIRASRPRPRPLPLPPLAAICFPTNVQNLEIFPIIESLQEIRNNAENFLGKIQIQQFSKTVITRVSEIQQRCTKIRQKAQDISYNFHLDHFYRFELTHSQKQS